MLAQSLYTATAPTTATVEQVASITSLCERLTAVAPGWTEACAEYVRTAAEMPIYAATALVDNLTRSLIAAKRRARAAAR